MNDLVKNLSAELGAAKAEVERLREALRPFAAFEAVRSKQGGCTPKSGTVWAVASISEEAEITVEHLQATVSALSQQVEPVEPAPAQDEQHDSPNMEPEGANAYLVVDPDDNYHICYVVRSKDQALQHATDGLLAFGPITQGNDS
ncbi:hypothetical protein [Stutzerimonas stutzeri]|uniref:Uncharacterized protein n=1 Tax=Stutzerimonas stutzeri TaxID=316 RepID=A0AA42TAZ5_STUST|nr:hypothetical protein [Stutzerimonas stutzeri]MDH1236488.1 hypothetical protein [Stutzerimonas stutzeri]